MTNTTNPEVRVLHRPAGWTLPDYTDLADCTTNHTPQNANKPPCTNTATWKVVELHTMHTTFSFWCDTHLPDEHRHPATASPTR